MLQEINIEEVKKIAHDAGREVLKIYQTDFDVNIKKDKSPVTEADLLSDKIIRKGLEKFNLPILSEESVDDKSRLNSDYVWIADPLDGTRDFVEKTGEFAIMIGLVYKNEPVLGVIYEPVSDRFYYSEKEKGAFVEVEKKSMRIGVSRQDEYQSMGIFISRNHPGKVEVKMKDDLGIGKSINMGSSGLKMARISEGIGEIYINSSDKSSEWDTCAGTIILQEAGGMITDMKGQKINYNNNNPRHLDGYVVTNGEKHWEILSQLRDIDAR